MRGRSTPSICSDTAAEPEEGPPARDESRSLGHGADRSSLSARSQQFVIGSDSRQGWTPGGRTPETARPGPRMPTKRGLRSPALGLGGGDAYWHTRPVLRDLLCRQLLSAAVSRGKRPEPHPDKLRHRRAEPSTRRATRPCERPSSALRPRLLVGVGAFAEARARIVLGEGGPRIGRILHPSPASPAANRGWAEAASRQLIDLGVDLP